MSSNPQNAARFVREPDAYPYDSSQDLRNTVTQQQQVIASLTALAKDRQLENFTLRSRLLEAEAKLLQHETTQQLQATIASTNPAFRAEQTPVAVVAEAVDNSVKRATRSSRDR